MWTGTAKQLYRYDIRYNKIYLSTYAVQRKTKCGYRIRLQDRLVHKFVNMEATKQFASETKEKALEGFMRRKQMQQLHLTTQLKEVENAIKLVESGDFENKEVVVDVDFGF